MGDMKRKRRERRENRREEEEEGGCMSTTSAATTRGLQHIRKARSHIQNNPRSALQDGISAVVGTR
jgi:hypothetical protein